jgi:hypothetical protein
MAMTAPAASQREIAKFLLVSEYRVRRIGKYPSVTIRLTECSYLTGDTLVVSAHTTNQSGAVTSITVQDLGPGSQVGHLIVDDQSNALTTISGQERTLLTPAVESTELGVPSVPATYSTTLTFATPLASAALDLPMAIVEKMPVGTNAYRPTVGGKSWEIYLDGQDPQAMGQMAQLLGGVYFASAKALFAKLGVSKTDGQILGAIQALGAEGTNIDGFLAQQGELVEGKRQAGQLGFAMVAQFLPMS